MEPRLVTGLVSIGTYYIYHRFEPNNLALHALFLLGTPIALASYHVQPHGSLIHAAIYTLAIHWTSILVLTVVYRLSWFHPLAAYPGPVLARVSKLWMMYVTSTGRTHEVVRELHRQHGYVVRVGPNELSFARMDAIKPIMSGRTLKKGPYYATRVLDGTMSLDGLREWTEHSSRRKPWTRAMSTAALKGYEPLLVEMVAKLVDRLEDRARNGEVIDISHWMSFFSFDFMGKMTFNHAFKMLDTGNDVDNFQRIIDAGLVALAHISHIPWTTPFLAHVPNKDVHAAREFGKQRVAERVQAGPKHKDLFYYLSGEDNTDEVAEVSMEELKADSLLAIIAGSDTSATTLSHIWYFMLRHPEYYSRLRKEVQNSFPGGEDPVDFARQAEMPYLNACINEALRLLPPVLTGLQRRVDTGTGGMLISDSFVPDRTQVSVHQYTLNKSPVHFSPLSDVFWPDRWLVQDIYTLPSGDRIRQHEVKTDRSVFLPFSAGPQNCAGKALAIVELRAVVCAIVQRFAAMEIVEDSDMKSWERNVADMYVSLRGSLRVRLKTNL